MHRSITGAALVAGVVGRPIAHSLSPALHNAWIAAAGLDALYAPFAPADEAGFAVLVAAGRAGLIRGLNVTAPFKMAALASSDTATERARACGSANLLLFEGGRLRADSTDGAGLMAALAEQAPTLDLRDRTVVILGAGGAARAAAAALVGAGARVRLVNRTPGHAQALAEALGRQVEVSTGRKALEDAALVVNALSSPPDADLSRLRADTVLMDMTYRPVRTRFLEQGRLRGHVTVDGLAMLIGQARPSFHALFGVAAPDIDVRAVALAAIGAGA